MSTENTIVLKGKGHHSEAEADGAITPGMGVEMESDGNYRVPQGTQAATLKRKIQIAKEPALDEGGTIDTAYADGDRVFLYQPVAGDHVNLLVKSAEDITKGDFLVIEAAGSGLFVEAAGTEVKFQAMALETVGALGSNDHVKCRWLD
jgi:hypothetical protein